MAETVTSEQYFKRSSQARYRQVASPEPPIATSAAIDDSPVLDAPDLVSRPKANSQTKSRVGSLRLSRYEILMLMLTFLVVVGSVFINLIMQSKTQSIQRSSQELMQQTLELQKQKDVMRDQMTEQYKYDNIKQAAEKQGMKVRQDSVKDLTKP